MSEKANYLRMRKYGVSERCVCDSKMGFFINDVFLTEYQVSVLATYEACKNEDAKPDGLALDYMAKACLKISEHPSLHSLAADEGHELAARLKEWKNPEKKRSSCPSESHL
jgi:hypothetical protein